MTICLFYLLFFHIFIYIKKKRERERERERKKEKINLLSLFTLISVEIYTSESSGSDETGDGSKDNPFKTVLQVYSVVNIQLTVKEYWQCH